MKKAILIYYTGTYNTRYIAEKIKEKISDYYDVDHLEVDLHTPAVDLSSYDLIGLGYPIYAFNAPSFFLNYLKKMKFPKDKQYFIFKNSGESFALNNASSRKIIKYLKKNKVNRFSEYHFLMPYNIHFRYDDAFIYELFEADRKLLEVLKYDILNDDVRHLKSNFLYDLVSRILRIQTFGGYLNSYFYRVEDTKCIKCGLCVKKCPVENIYYKNGKIKEEATYMNSKLNGFYSEYYENGNLKTRQFFNSGVPDGDLIGYYENGNPSIIAKYDNGTLLNNKYVQFEDDGSCFLIYEENFLRNANAWMYEGQNGNITINDTGDYITLNAAPGRTVSGGIDTGFSQDSENIIEFFVSQNSEPNSSVGILFGFKDWHNYCALYIGRDQYLFRYIKNGEQMTDEHWEYSKYIEKDANKITIVNTQEALNILINDMVVWQSQSFQYDGTFCGVTADNNGTGDAIVNLGRLSVYELVTDERVISQYLPNKQYGDWAGNGSGFFLTEDGYLATNYHVVEDANAIEVTFVRNGVPENYPATVVMSDKQNDLSILKISDDGFKEMPPIPYNITTTVRDTGSEVFTLGYPIADVMGTEVKFTDGKISSKTGMQGDVTVYQISVPIQPGNSGGPLFDSEGNLIGITSSALNREYFKSENVNYAIKSSYLKALVDVLPGNIKLQTSANISSLPLTEKIKLFQPYMLYIKVK